MSEALKHLIQAAKHIEEILRFTGQNRELQAIHAEILSVIGRLSTEMETRGIVTPKEKDAK